MEKYVEDREYIQPECETVDWLVYAEYVAYKLRQIGQVDTIRYVGDIQSGESLG